MGFAPLVVVTLNAARVRVCDYWGGLAFYLVLPLVSVACASALGVAAAGSDPMKIEFLTKGTILGVPVILSSYGLTTLTTGDPTARAAFERADQAVYWGKANGRNYALSQLEATDARRAFPSFDEPAFKASWRVAVTAPTTDTVLGNAPTKAPSEASFQRMRSLRLTATLSATMTRAHSR